jgi:hypothetical protein
VDDVEAPLVGRAGEREDLYGGVVVAIEDEYGSNVEDFEQPEGYEGEVEAPTGAEGITIKEELARARRALLEVVLADPYAWGVYERQCGQGIIGLHGRAKVLRQAMEKATPGEHHEQGAVEAAVTGLAVETHPDSPAAAWERLASHVQLRRDNVASLDGGAGERMVGAIVDLVVKEERHFASLTHLALDSDGPKEEELLGVSREIFAALRRDGRRVRPAGFSGHVWRALLEILPDAPGVRWDPAWADALATRAVVHVAKRHASESKEYVAGRPGVGAAVDEVGAAFAAQDRRRYLKSLRTWAAATLGTPTSTRRSTSTGGHRRTRLDADAG